MKKNICFAGFAESELPELRAAIATSNPQWESHFTADAAAALAMLTGKRFDALVANMDMPGKNGAELLREVHETCPNTLGFIVGEVTDQAHIINCIGGTHQFIRRPFQPAKLIATLKRGLKRDQWLATEELRKLAPKLRRLPSLPSTYFNLMREVESVNATMQGIGSVIARDPVATARLLQICNSAAFGLVEKVTDPVHAVTLLGIETVKSLVMSLQVFSQSDIARGSGLSLEILWEHSLLVAKYARQITLKQTGDVKLAGEAFTAGLLHDVGRIVLASNLPKEYAAIIASAREHARPLHEEETAKLRVNHAEVGAYLLGLWGLPTEIVEAAGGHHAPGQTVYASEFSLLGAVHAANVFAHETGGQTDGLCLPELDLVYFRMVKLGDALAGWREVCTGEKAPAPMKLTGESEAKVVKPVKPVASAENKTVKTIEPSAAPVTEDKTSPTPGLTMKEPAPPLVPLIKPVQIEEPASRFSGRRVSAGVLVWVLIVGCIGTWAFYRQTASPESVVAIAPKSTVVKQPQAVAVTKAKTDAGTNQTTLVSVKAPAGPFDGIRVQGIFYETVNPVAIINGKTVGVGDRLNGVKVVNIDQSSVTLAQDGEQKVFKLN